MARYRLFIEYPFVGAEPEEDFVDMPPAQRDKELAEALDALISNHLDTGWELVDAGD